MLADLSSTAELLPKLNIIRFKLVQSELLAAGKVEVVS